MHHPGLAVCHSPHLQLAAPGREAILLELARHSRAQGHAIDAWDFLGSQQFSTVAAEGQRYALMAAIRADAWAQVGASCTMGGGILLHIDSAASCPSCVALELTWCHPFPCSALNMAADNARGGRAAAGRGAAVQQPQQAAARRACTRACMAALGV